MTRLDELLFGARNNVFPEISGNTDLPISANDVTETSDKNFINASEKAQLISSQADLASLGQRVQTVEDELDGLTSTDEFVKMDANDTSGYLADKLDGTTLININGKIVTKTLDGMNVTIEELNYLSGVTSSVQNQINALSSITNFSEIVDNETLLPATVGQAGATVLVREDSTQDYSSTFYTSDGTSWVYVNKINSSATRDFTVNPIDLENETGGVLQKTKYEKQNSAETPFTDSTGNIQATNAEEAIKEVFLFSDNIRKQWSSAIGLPLTATDKLPDQLIKYNSLMENIAQAITAKGVPTYAYNKLNELPNKIASIPSTEVTAGLGKVEILNANAGHVENIVLTESLSLQDVTTNLIEVVGGNTDVTHYDLNFTMDESSKFQENIYVDFEGEMKLKTGVDVDMIKVTSHTGDYNKYTYRVIEENFETMNGYKVV